ncbi:hypothetical protein NFI96_025976, partial [Prochilodus magdalenae]
ETSAQTIDPLVGEVQLPEGDDLTFSCNYTSRNTGDVLQWYRQSPGSSPEFLLYIDLYGSKSDPPPRMSAVVDNVLKRVDLKISSAAVSDSVLYYCALRPTVPGNPDTLVLLLEVNEMGLFLEVCRLKLLKFPWPSESCVSQSISPLEEKVDAVEGETVTLSCSYEYTGSIPSLHWYRQYPGSRPEFLLLIQEASEIVTKAEKLNAQMSIKVHKEEKKKVDLKISSAAVSDSVLYYCALGPTVTGNPDTLYRNWFYD